MKRSFTSVCCGVLLPLLHYATALAVGFAVDKYAGWERVPSVFEFLLFFPAAWPDALYSLLFKPEMFDFLSLTFLSLVTFGNFVLYAFLTYRLLGRFAPFKDREQTARYPHVCGRPLS